MYPSEAPATPARKSAPIAGFCLVAAWLLLARFHGTLAAAESPWIAGPGFRYASLTIAEGGRTGFTPISSERSGIRFTNSIAELSGAANRVLYNGSGLATGDYDGDGLPDLFLCNLNGRNVLYRNQGDWRFTEVTREAGLDSPLPESRGAVFADLNGDGTLDLLVSVNRQGVRVFLNNGRGRFTDATAQAGTASRLGSTTLTLADIDGDGTLDLYVANYRPDDIRDRGRAQFKVVNGRPFLPGAETNRFIFLNGHLEECGQPDQLFLNDGKGRFRPVDWTGGQFLNENGRPLVEGPPDWGLTAAFHDINGDLAPDLYVCNDYWTPDRLWINDGKGRFRAAGPMALRHLSASSMGVDFADIDHDGNIDLFVVEMLSRYPALRKRQMAVHLPGPSPIGLEADRPQVLQNTLFLNRGDGTFAELADFAGLAATDWSWSPLFIDVDLDGFADLLISAGHFRDVQDADAEAQIKARQHSWAGVNNEAERQRLFTREVMEHCRLYPLLRLPIAGFRNRRDGTFEEQTAAWGLDVRAVHHGMALADFDRDGDLDLVVNDLNDPVALFRNDAPGGRVAVRLKGRGPNSQAIGAQVSLLNGAVPNQTAEITCGGHYLSGSDTQVVFAAPANATNLTLEARWRGGGRTVIQAVHCNRLYEIDEGTAPSEPGNPQGPAAIPPPLFEDWTPRLAHRHAETNYNDHERQPLLPMKLSQLGPGVASLDLDGDGHEDLAIGAGRGASPAVFRGDGRGGFSRLPQAPTLVTPDDTAGMVGWIGADGRRELLVSRTGYEAKVDPAIAALRWTGLQLEAGTNSLSGMATSGALALADLSGSGEWVLFAAGGVMPGQYPAGAASNLYRWDGRRWNRDERNHVLLENLGIVNGALWSDLDGDGTPELVLACEWGPVRVFRWQSGALRESTQDFGLQAYTGWWRGIAAGDLNNDGRMDLIVANWGWNSPYQASPAQPQVFAYGQMAQPGVMDVVEAEYIGQVLAPRRRLSVLGNSLPFILDSFPSHRAFSEASLDGVLGDRRPLSRRVSATTLASTLFLNTGSGFRAVALPREAQFAAAFSVHIADADGDGNDDVFLTQNFFGTQPEIPRLDAGTGLWLKGDGTGGLTARRPSQTGIRLFGEQRGAALGDFDEDGRVDLAVAQNGAATALFHNVSARPGLRIRLQGTPGNPSAIGAVIRLQFQGRLGPAREIHAGSGYGSMDSPIPVLGAPSRVDAVWIRWPGGRVTTTSLAGDSTEVVIRADGTLVSKR